MKESTRALIAAAAAEKITGRLVQRVFDHAQQSALPVTKHLSQAQRRERPAPVVLHDTPDRVSLRVRDDLFVGWDHVTGAYVAGAMYEADVMLFDSLERRYYRFRIHQAALDLIPYAPPIDAQGTQLQET
jgi:hypothetical protein